MRPLLFAFVLFCIATQFGPHAAADPPGANPHLPNLQFGYCPGGQGAFLRINGAMASSTPTAASGISFSMQPLANTSP